MINHRLSSIVPLIHVVFYTLILTAQVSSASPNVSVRWTVSEEGRRVGERRRGFVALITRKCQLIPEIVEPMELRLR